MKFFSKLDVMRFFYFVFLLLCGLSVQAQPAVDGSLLGINEPELKQLFPDIHRLARPVLGPHHIKGSWRLDQSPLANLSLTTTFFFKDSCLVRIEQQAVQGPPVAPVPMANTTWFADLQAKYGPGLTANNTDAQGQLQQSTLWVAQGADVSLYFTQQVEQSRVLLVYQPHHDKDASEL